MLRASLERKALGKAGVGWIAVMAWICLRAALFKSSKFMIQQLCGRLGKDHIKSIVRVEKSVAQEALILNLVFSQTLRAFVRY